MNKSKTGWIFAFAGMIENTAMRRSLAIVSLGLCLGILSVVTGYVDSVSHWEVPLFIIGAGLDIWRLVGIGL